MSQKIKGDNVALQKKTHKRILERQKKSNLMTAEAENELRDILEGYYCERYD